MNLLKYYSLKQSKSDEIIFFTFPFIGAHSKIRREKRQLRNRLFAHEGHLFLSEIREIRPEDDNFGLFLRPSIIALWGWARSRIVRPQESLVIRKSFNPLCYYMTRRHS
jgi:hypothetical protein